MPPEVRYHMLRPAQIVKRRQACPVAYVPLGNVEWHGFHNPVGADTLQAEGLAILCARKGGGLVMPPLYYGENRLESLMEANAADHDKICASMELRAENFSAQRQWFGAAEQTLNYNRLLLHILCQVDSLGFAVGVLVAGHYPLIDHARAAVMLYNQSRRDSGRQMLAWACLDYLMVQERWSFAGDHAAGWETSHLLALHPETVDMSVLPPKGSPLVGVTDRPGRMPVQDANADLGRETLEAAAEAVVREVAHRLAHPDLYWGHAQHLNEGLWRR